MSRLDLIKIFGNEDADTFNKCSIAYEKGREDGFYEAVDSCIAYVDMYDSVIADYMRDAFEREK